MMEYDDDDYCSDESQHDAGTFIVQSSQHRNNSSIFIDITVNVSESDLTTAETTKQCEGSPYLNPPRPAVNIARQHSLTPQGTALSLDTNNIKSIRSSSLPLFNNRLVSIFESSPSPVKDNARDEDHTKEFTLRYKTGETIIKNDELKFDAEVATNHVEEDYQMNGHDQVMQDETKISPSSFSSRRKHAADIALALHDQKDCYQPKSNYCELGRCCNWLNTPKQSKDLQFAESAGFKLLPSFFFPAVPKLLEDFWVMLELLVVFFDFLFNCIVYSGTQLDTFVVAFSVFAVVLSLLDTYLYFVEGSSCKSCVKRIRSKLSSPVKESTNSNHETARCHTIPDSLKKKLETWLQVVRTVVVELVLFPLTIADLIELIELQTYSGSDAEARINFGLFIVGIFFLILTVYFMRIFMALSSIVSVKRLPKSTSNDTVLLVIKFCLHLIAQTVVHASIFIMISSKLHHETCTDYSNLSSTNNSSTSVTISPFLWYQMGAGAFLPLVGTIFFFLLNYPALKQFSVSMYVDIMTTVVNESFADLMFQGEGIKTAKRKADKVAKKSQVSSIRSEFESYRKQFTFKHKMVYRLTTPLVVIGSTAYFYITLGFFVCHSLGYANPCDGSSEIVILLFKDTFITVTFFVGLCVTMIANYQLLVTVSSLLLIGIGCLLILPVLIILFFVGCIVRTYNNKNLEK